MTQTRIGFINEHGMDLEELSARTVVTNCAGDFVDDFDMDAVEDDYEAARDAVVEAVRPDLYFSWCTNEIMGEVGTAPLSDDDWAAIEEGLEAIDMAAIFQAHDLTTK
mgnify:FL=1